MSATPQRKTPTEMAIRVVKETEFASIVEEVKELTPTEMKLNSWREKVFAGEAVKALPPRKWLIKGWLPLDGEVAIYGPPGGGKSFYALTLSLEIARGGKWAGCQIDEPTKVLYIAAERSADIRDRAEAWGEYYETTLPDSWLLFAPDRAPQLSPEGQDLNDLCAFIEEMNVRVVFIDTFARVLIGKEENSAKDMGPIMEGLSRVRQATKGGTVVVIHHTGKDTAKGLRGSNSILGALDVTIELKGDSTAYEARVDKANAGKKPPSEWYSLTDVQLPHLETSGLVEVRYSAVFIQRVAPEIASGLEPLITELLLDSFGGEASQAKVRQALLDAHGREVSEATLGKVFTRMGKAGILTKTGRGPNTRWVLNAEAAELDF
jgi:hypothetical protein